MTINDAADAVTTATAALALTLDGVAIPVEKGKQPVQGDGEGANTQITVFPAPVPLRHRRFTSVHDLETYFVRVAFWTPNAQSNTANLDEIAGIARDARQAFEKKPVDLLGIDQLRDCRCEQGPFIPSDAFREGWDVVAIDVELDVVVVR